MVKFLINRPVAVFMVFVALVLLGCLAANKITITPLPNVDIPEITVQVVYKDVSAKDLDNRIVLGLRRQLQNIDNLEDIGCETRDGYSIIRLRFNYGTNIDFSFMEINEKIDLLMNSFPREMERPRVVKSSISDLPVFYLNLTLKNDVTDPNNLSRFIQLGEFTDQVIKRRMEQLSEIAFVDITGIVTPEVYVVPNPTMVNGLNFHEQDFKRIIEDNNLSFGAALVEDGQLQYNIRFSSSNLNSVEDIKNIIFRHNDRIFKLGDIAEVGLRQENLKGSFSANNSHAISLAVIKQPSASMGDLRENLKRLILSLEKQYGYINFHVSQDETEILDYSISNLKQDLIMGGGVAFCLMFFFLKDFRSPFLIGITVPVSLVLSLLAFYLIGLTINIISLSGLVLGVGLMIDNSIIVIDNISQQRERGFDLPTSCVNGTNEIIRPLVTSVLTTCSVFLPLIFMSGISGALFFDQAMAVSVGVTISLIVSITLLPTLYKLIHKNHINKTETAFFDKYGIQIFEKLYEAGFKWVFKHKIISFVIVLLLVFSNIFIFNALKKERLPVFEQNELMVNIDWNQNINVNENNKRINSLMTLINHYLIQSNYRIGEQQYLLNKDRELSSSETQIYMSVRDSTNISLLKNAIVNHIKIRFPEATVLMKPPLNIFERVFGDQEEFLEARVGSNISNGIPSSSQFKLFENNSMRIYFVNNLINIPNQNTLVLTLDIERLMVYDVSVESVYQSLRLGLNSLQIGSLQNGNQFTPIILNGGSKYINDILANTTVGKKDGTRLPIRDFMKISNEVVYKTIKSDLNGNYIPLPVQTDNPEMAMSEIRTLVNSDPTLEVGFTGSYFSNRKLIHEMCIVLVVAVLLLYFILAAQFESFIQPVIVLVEIPISLSGALIMLYLFGSSINLIALIGLVVICGIIINDSVLKLDTINGLIRNEGYELMEAIHTAGKRRLKSIIMTSMTTMLSVAPFMFGKDMGAVLQRPLSLTLIGGMSLGTLVSLYFIPLVYWYYYSKKNIKC